MQYPKLLYGADIDQVEWTGGLTALIRAAKLGHVESVRRLTASHADIWIRDRDGKRTIDWPEQRGHETIASLLAECGKSTSH